MPFFILAKTILKSISRLPATRRYPFGPKRPDYPNARGRIVTDISKCIFCGLCQSKCPAAAITVIKENKIWQLDRLRCVTCGYCVDVCPHKCLSMETAYTQPMLKKAEGVYQQHA